MTELRALGSSDLLVSPFCLGGNVFGWTADKTQSFAVLDGYLAAGGNFIDTSDSYMNYFPEQGNEPGQSETIIGDWLATHRNRDDVVVATKVGDHPKYILIRNLLGSLVEDVSDVRGFEVAGDDVGLALSAVEEPAGFSSEFGPVSGPLGVGQAAFEVGVDQLVRVQLG